MLSMEKQFSNSIMNGTKNNAKEFTPQLKGYYQR